MSSDCKRQLIDSVVMLFLRPTDIFISVLVDTVIIGFLFILNLGEYMSPGAAMVHAFAVTMHKKQGQRGHRV